MARRERVYPWVSLGAVSASVAVILGALGSHALRSRLDAGGIRAWEIGTDYQLAHALALLLVGLLQQDCPLRGRRFLPVGLLFLTGTILFCGSLYGLALTKWSVLGPITPFGGLCFILGWLVLAKRTWNTIDAPSEPVSAKKTVKQDNND